MEPIANVLDKQVLDDVTQKALAFYNEHLKAKLEPEFNGQVVVLHLDSGSYVVGRNSTLVARQLREQQPDGLTATIDIGLVPMNDPLTLRIFGQVPVGRKA